MEGLVQAGALTRKELLVPDSDPPEFRVAVIVKVPLLEIVTLWDASIPFAKAAVVPLPADKVPVEEMETLLDPPLKLVTVLLKASTARTLILKATPAVCVPILASLVFVTAKLLNGPGLTVTPFVKVARLLAPPPQVSSL